MSTWRIQLKLGKTSKEHKEAMKFCIDNNVIAVGWYLENKYDDYYKLRDEVKKYPETGYGKSALQSINAVRKMQINDLVWTRTPDEGDEYYLCRVTKRWIDCPNNDEYLKYDVANYVCCEWIKIGKASRVPGKVVNSFISRRSAQHINGNRIDEISQHIWNKNKPEEINHVYDVSKLTKENFWTLIGSEEVECLVILYLQLEKDYIIYSSTLKKSTAKYECVMTSKDGSHHCYPQVKKDEILEPSNYYTESIGQKDKVFLFTTSENYGTAKHPQVECISKLELENFMMKNKKILPASIAYWLDWLDEADK